MRLHSSYPFAALLLALGATACGSTPASDSADEPTTKRFDPIVGGVVDDASSHDAVVMVYNEKAGAMCTGTVISQDGQKGVVITARHCVSQVNSEYVTCNNDVGNDYPATDLYVVSGSDPMHGSYRVLGTGDKIFHTPGTSLCNGDFAVVVLQETVSGIVPLRVRTNPDAYKAGEHFTAIGYGLTNPNNNNSSGRRYLRQDVTVTSLGPTIGMVYSNEFLGTASICSGDSGGPAVSANWAIMGVTSRGANCYGNDNIWSRVDGFKDVIDEAMTYANATYVPEDGAPPWPGDTGGTGGSSGAGGSDSSGGSGGQGSLGSGGTGGTTVTPTPSCNDFGPCPTGSRCITDPASGQRTCVAACDAQSSCPDGSSCDPQQGVCVASPSTAAAMDQPVSVGGGCSVARGRSSQGAAALLVAALAWFSARRRKRQS